MSHGISQIENRAMVWKQHQTFSGGATGVGGVMPNGQLTRCWFVDGDRSASGSGKSWDEAFATIQEGLDACSNGDIVYVASKAITDATGDPTNYAEVLTMETAQVALIGVSRGRTQGGVPQVKMGSGSTALLTVQAPGCLIANMGFNGSGSTGGGILLDDDNSTKSAFGTTIANCHLKNCKGTTATDSRTGGAIMWSAEGNAWQVLITGCRFYKNVGDVVLKGTSNSVPQDVVIEDCIFSGPAANVDCNLYLAGGSGMNGVYINRCIFPELPALSSGSVVRFADLTGCVGIISNCMFGCCTDANGTELTFKAAGTAVKLPTTVFICGCYGQSETDAVTGEINIS